jgi:hypothetical protein
MASLINGSGLHPHGFNASHANSHAILHKTRTLIASLQAAARMLRLQRVVTNAGTDSDLEPAFTIFSQQRVGAVLVARVLRPPAIRTGARSLQADPVRDYTLNCSVKLFRPSAGGQTKRLKDLR